MSRILVIDDSGAIRKAIRRIVEPLGYQVEEASDGRQALDALARGPAFTAVLCDFDMPNLDGLGFLDALRQRADFHKPPVIMCVTHNTFERIPAALALGAAEYVMKPFDAEILSGKLAACGVQS
jgi:two-component system chemotaxis response regulator CheY